MQGMNLSKLSTPDLKALQSGNISGVSTVGLKYLQTLSPPSAPTAQPQLQQAPAGMPSNPQQGQSTLQKLNSLGAPSVVTAGAAIGNLIDPAISQFRQNFMGGVTHPFSNPSNVAGFTGQMAALGPVADAGALLRAGRALPAVGQAIGKIGDFFNPATANGVMGSIGKSALNSSVGGAGLGAAGAAVNGNSILPGMASGAAVGGTLGTLAGAAGGALNIGRYAALNQLGKSQTVQDFIDKLSGNAPVAKVQGNALQAVDTARQNAQAISNDNYQSIFKQANQMGIDASNPPNLTSTAQGLVDQVNRMGPDYNGLKNDVLMAAQPFNLQNRLFYALKSTMNDPKSALVTAKQLANNPPNIQQQILNQMNPEERMTVEGTIQQPFGLEDINNLKQSFQQDVQKALSQGDMKAAGVYGQLGDAARNDTLQLTQGTPLQAQLVGAHNFYAQHVLPLQPVKQMAQNGDINAFKSSLLNPANANTFGALTPTYISNANGLDPQTLLQAKNTAKASLITKASSDTGQVDPSGTLKNYMMLANNPNYAHLFAAQKPGNAPLFEPNDVANARDLGVKMGLDEQKLTPGDVGYEVAAASGHASPWLVRKAVDIGGKLLPSGNSNLNNPAVVNAMMQGGIPAAQAQLRNMMIGSPLMNRIPALATNSLLNAMR